MNLKEKTMEKKTSRPNPFRVSTEHPGGTIQIQRVDKAIRIDLGSEDFEEFKWEWMDIKTAKWIRDQLTIAIGDD